MGDERRHTSEASRSSSERGVELARAYIRGGGHWNMRTPEIPKQHRKHKLKQASA